MCVCERMCVGGEGGCVRVCACVFVRACFGGGEGEVHEDSVVMTSGYGHHGFEPRSGQTWGA